MIDWFRAQMSLAAEEKDRVKSAAGSGTSVCSLGENERFTITRWDTGYANRISIIFNRPIIIAAGDVVKFKISQISGEALKVFSYGYIGYPSMTLWSNLHFNSSVKNQVFSATAQNSGEMSWFYMQQSTGSKAPSPAAVLRVSVWVNDILLIGEG